MADLEVGATKSLSHPNQAQGRGVAAGDRILVYGGAYDGVNLVLPDGAKLLGIVGDAVAKRGDPAAPVFDQGGGNGFVRAFGLDNEVAGFHMQRAKDRTARGIQIGNDGGYFHDLTIRECDHGIQGAQYADGRGWLRGAIRIEDVLLDTCGNGSGQTHNLYVGTFGMLRLTRVGSLHPWVGHHFKIKFGNSISTDCWARDRAVDATDEWPNSSGICQWEFPFGGSHIIRNFDMYKGLWAEQGAIVNMLAEWGEPELASPVNKLVIENGTMRMGPTHRNKIFIYTHPTDPGSRPVPTIELRNVTFAGAAHGFNSPEVVHPISVAEGIRLIDGAGASSGFHGPGGWWSATDPTPALPAGTVVTHLGLEGTQHKFRVDGPMPEDWMIVALAFPHDGRWSTYDPTAYGPVVVQAPYLFISQHWNTGPTAFRVNGLVVPWATQAPAPPPPPPSAITVTANYLGLGPDLVGRNNDEPAPDLEPDAWYRVRLAQPVTIAKVRLAAQPSGGTWDTDLSTPSWNAGVAIAAPPTLSPLQRLPLQAQEFYVMVAGPEYAPAGSIVTLEVHHDQGVSTVDVTIPATPAPTPDPTPTPTPGAVTREELDALTAKLAALEGRLKRATVTHTLTLPES